MKTLDEVIKMLEETIDTTDVDCPMMTLFEGDATDTLHYLKEYRDYRNPDKTVIENGSVPEAGNEPLSWDELKTMQGKPVWLEEGDYKGWEVVKDFETTYDGVEYINLSGLLYERKHMGNGKDDWRTFRKERK